MILYYEWLFSNGEKASVYQFKGDLSIDFQQGQETIEQQNSKNQTITQADIQHFSKRTPQTPAKVGEEIAKRTVHTAPMKSGVKHRSVDTTPRKLVRFDENLDFNPGAVEDLEYKYGTSPFIDMASTKEKKKQESPGKDLTMVKPTKFGLESLFDTRSQSNKPVAKAGDVNVTEKIEMTFVASEKQIPIIDGNPAQNRSSRFGLDGLFMKLNEKSPDKKAATATATTTAEKTRTDAPIIVVKPQRLIKSKIPKDTPLTDPKEMADKPRITAADGPKTVEPVIDRSKDSASSDKPRRKETTSKDIKSDKPKGKTAKETNEIIEINSSSDLEIASGVKQYNRLKTKPTKIMIKKVPTSKKPPSNRNSPSLKKDGQIINRSTIVFDSSDSEDYTTVEKRSGRMNDASAKATKDSSKENAGTGPAVSAGSGSAAKVNATAASSKQSTAYRKESTGSGTSAEYDLSMGMAKSTKETDVSKVTLKSKVAAVSSKESVKSKVTTAVSITEVPKSEISKDSKHTEIKPTKPKPKIGQKLHEMILDLDKHKPSLKRKAPTMDSVLGIAGFNVKVKKVVNPANDRSGNQKANAADVKVSMVLGEKTVENSGSRNANRSLSLGNEGKSSGGAKSEIQKTINQRSSSGFLGQFNSGIQKIIHKATSGLLGSSNNSHKPLEVPSVGHNAFSSTSINPTLPQKASGSSRLSLSAVDPNDNKQNKNSPNSESSQTGTLIQKDAQNSFYIKKGPLSKVQKHPPSKPVSSLKSIFKEKEMDLNGVRNMRKSLSRYLPDDSKLSGDLDSSQAVFRAGEVQEELDRILNKTGIVKKSEE
jgi:hypothetical protein